MKSPWEGLMGLPSAVRWTAWCVWHRRFGVEERLMLADEWWHVLAPGNVRANKACERFQQHLNDKDDHE